MALNKRILRLRWNVLSTFKNQIYIIFYTNIFTSKFLLFYTHLEEKNLEKMELKSKQLV